MRLAHGLTAEQVAEELLCSPSKVSRMETGQRAATPRDVRDLCRIYGVTDDAQVTLLMDMAREGKQQAWWQPYELDYFATYVGLEQAATSLSYFMSAIVPGLLQTADYARAMLASALPAEFNPAEFNAERTDQLIDVRLRRQQVLTRDPPMQISVVLDEAVLHRVVGSPAVMAAQLRHLVEASGMPNIALQVIPFAAGAHPAMDDLFTILDFGSVAAPVVYIEGLMGWLYIEREHEVARYRRIFDHLCSVALSPRETTELMSEVGAKYNRTP
jgi:transcriptional regulator with XRE-family HTH domain